MIIKKIKLSRGNGITITASKSSNGKTSEITLHSEELPAPELLAALEKAGEIAVKICELPKKSEVKVRGISMSYHGEDQTPAVIITITKELSIGNTSITINTPLKYLEEGEKIVDSSILEEEEATIIENILEEGKKYLDGVREQTDLFS